MEDEFTPEGAELLFSHKKAEAHASVMEEDNHRVCNLFEPNLISLLT